MRQSYFHPSSFIVPLTLRFGLASQRFDLLPRNHAEILDFSRDYGTRCVPRRPMEKAIEGKYL